MGTFDNGIEHTVPLKGLARGLPAIKKDWKI
jgi:hypothetical protein